MSQIVLLGPQRHQPTVASVLAGLGLGNGDLAVVTAGWQEREGEVDELADHVRRPVTNLHLHHRAESLFERSPQLFQALRQRQNRLRELQRLHRLRLDYVLKPARRLLRRSAPSEFLDEERREALDAVRHLDARHEERLGRIHREFDEQWQESFQDAIQRDRAEIAEILSNSSALAIAGGHVAVLLNRLRLFGITELRGELPIVAWSAGAMVLGKKVVLFHDRPPQGAGNAEVLETGLGLFDDVLPLPHASYRLRLEDPVRVSLFVRRFAPAACVTLDPGDQLALSQGHWQSSPSTRQLLADGGVSAFREGS
ncbi:MAG: Type 1 glutamine amidotransferase-like domain-containing protein [Deltaproteobacteria bacterium]|nr:Type 1 glutamine amidotransferase-like domain-containing protein [Deltaproteobacteria bacterium]